MTDCQSILRQLWDYLDGELPDERRAVIDAHLRICGECFPTFRFEESFLRAVKTAREDVSQSGELAQRVIAAMRRDGMPELPPPPGGES